MSGLSVGELFVSLGVKGADKTVGQLMNVQKGMNENVSTAWELKAGIVAAFYALEQLTASGMSAGTSMVNFGTNTGMALKTLQQWEFGMKMAGGTAEEMDGSIRNLLNAMAAVDAAGNHLPAGLAVLSKYAGGIDWNQRFDPNYILPKMIKGIKALGDSPEAKSVANYLANTMGLGWNFVAGARRGLFDPSELAKAPVISDRAANALSEQYKVWTRLKEDMSKFSKEQQAQFAMPMITTVSSDLHTLMEDVIAFEKAWKEFSKNNPKWAEGMKGLAGAISLYLAPSLMAIQPALVGLTALHELLDKNSYFHQFADWSAQQEGVEGDKFREIQKKLGPKGILLHPLEMNKPLWDPSIWKPSVPGAQRPAGNTTVTVQQTHNYDHDGTDHKKAADAITKANRETLRQINQSQVQ